MSAPLRLYPSRLAALALTVALGCASAAAPAPELHVAREAAPRAPEPALEHASPPASDAVTRGELPWWGALAPGVYRIDGALMIVGIGDSRDHHHIAEGFLQAKVTARLGVRRASETIELRGGPAEPELDDLFITRERRVLALYVLRVPEEAALLDRARTLTVPAALNALGRHRVGRHVFEDERHLYLECDVEGPVANPDWGRSQAAARN